jgi:hypothetical protein
MGRADDAGKRHWRRLDEVFGEVLPETTADERDSDRQPDARSADPEHADRDTWLRSNRPPHHGT